MLSPKSCQGSLALPVQTLHCSWDPPQGTDGSSGAGPPFSGLFQQAGYLPRVQEAWMHLLPQPANCQAQVSSVQGNGHSTASTALLLLALWLLWGEESQGTRGAGA